MKEGISEQTDGDAEFLLRNLKIAGHGQMIRTGRLKSRKQSRDMKKGDAS